MSSAVSTWLAPGPTLDDWPVHQVGDIATRTVIGVSRRWSRAEPTTVGTQCSCAYRGDLRGEGLSITLLTGAVAGHDIKGWLSAPMAVTGGVDPQLMAWEGIGTILEWSASPSTGVAERVDADAAFAYTGLATFVADGDADDDAAAGTPPELIRLYALLAHRGEYAWKIGLALSSSLLPGSTSAEIHDNDHLRAQAIFSPLKLR